uniref:Uncharacterized protein n=1 Tax=Arundo donax TaxID=35708 RepID=A0A0A9CQS2_ARUDO
MGLSRSEEDNPFSPSFCFSEGTHKITLYLVMFGQSIDATTDATDSDPQSPGAMSAPKNIVEACNKTGTFVSRSTTLNFIRLSITFIYRRLGC